MTYSTHSHRINIQMTIEYEKQMETVKKREEALEEIEKKKRDYMDTYGDAVKEARKKKVCPDKESLSKMRKFKITHLSYTHTVIYADPRIRKPNEDISDTSEAETTRKHQPRQAAKQPFADGAESSDDENDVDYDNGDENRAQGGDTNLTPDMKKKLCQDQTRNDDGED